MILWLTSLVLLSSVYISDVHANVAKENLLDTNLMLKAYLGRSSFKHQVLSENIANLNTPKYKAEDVEMPTKYEDLVSVNKNSKQIGMRKTNNLHMAGSRKSNDGKFSRIKLKKSIENKPNGNNVSLSQQMLKISDNQQSYNEVLKAYAVTNNLTNVVLGK
jgi:flagellar basal-body rod protein FlgB